MRQWTSMKRIVFGLIAVVAVACADSHGTVGIEPDGGTGDAALDAPTFLEGSTTACGCSSDLHDVVGCDGVTTVETCPSDQACSSTGCIPACDAAAKLKSTVGCDYWVHNARFLNGAGCEALFVANTWNAPATLTAFVGTTSIDLAKYAYLPSGTGPSLKLSPVGGGGTIPPGQVGIVFLRTGPNVYACPAGVTTLETDAAAAGWTDPAPGFVPSDQAQALRVTSSVPIVAYDMLPFGGGHTQLSDASLLIPTAAWDTNYIAVTPSSEADDTFASFSIIASADNTTVIVKPTVDLMGNSPLPPVTAGTPHSYTLMKGQVLRLFGSTQNPAGSIVAATNPIGVWTESPCINVDGNNCDSAHEQLPPVRALGSEYVYARYRNRVDGQDETPPTTITGTVDGTTLTFDPVPTGALATIGRGQSVKVRSSVPFVVKSQDDSHPFYVTTSMTGGVAFGGAGDPEFVSVLASAQYLRRYVFFTDPTYPETNLVFIRKRDTAGFHDVSLDCAGTITGWKPVGSSTDYESTQLDLSRHDYQGQNGCDNGAHESHSTGSFTITVWGWGTSETGDINSAGYSQFVSYAYPVGSSVQPINTVVVTPN